MGDYYQKAKASQHLPSFSDMLGNCHQFTLQMAEKIGKKPTGKINHDFIVKMVRDEMKELDVAKDITEKIDAVYDAVYYILQHISTLDSFETIRSILDNPDFPFHQSFTAMKIMKMFGTSPPKDQDSAFLIMMVDGMMNRVALRKSEPDTGTVVYLFAVVSVLLAWVSTFQCDTLPVWNMIHFANMCKFSDDGHLGEDGKWYKPSNFVPPDSDIRLYLSNPAEFFTGTLLRSASGNLRASEAIPTSEPDIQISKE